MEGNGLSSKIEHLMKPTRVGQLSIWFTHIIVMKCLNYLACENFSV